MKLLRWTLAGASFYVIYKYSIGKKARGKDVFETPESNPPAPTPVTADPTTAAAAKPKRTRKAPAKRASKTTAKG